MENKISLNTSESMNNLFESQDNKIRLSCVLTDSCSEFDMEVNDRISIGSLKKKISDKLGQSKSFSVLLNEKDFTNFNQIKLSELLKNHKIKKEKEIIPNNENNNNKIIYRNQIQNQLNNKSNTDDFYQTNSSLNSLRLKIIPYDSQSIISTETKVKYMLECIYHPNENAHYFCFDCSKSFCALCMSDHSSHDFLDKYDYSKSNEEIVKNLMKNFILSIQENNRDCKKKISNVLLKKENAESNYNDTQEKIVNILNAINEAYHIYSNTVKEDLDNKVKEKVEDFKNNFVKFKLICLNNLKFLQKNKNGDIITLDDDYFKDLRKTLNELNIGKNALMKYLDVRNEECEYEKNESEKFDKEIYEDLQKILLKIKNKNVKIPYQSTNQTRVQTESNNNTITEFPEENNTSIRDDKMKLNVQEIRKNMNDPLKENKEIYINNNNLNDDNNKNFNNSNNNNINDTNNNNYYIPTESENINTGNFAKKIYLDTIMKRKLLHEIIIYNTKQKKFESRKKFRNKNPKFKKFLHYSVFININNILYISGGKDKEEKCISDFYSYDYYTNRLESLSNMLSERCSHSMIYLNNKIINNEIFVIGGYNNNTCERYNVKKNEWNWLPKLNEKERQVSTLFVFNEKILFTIFGFINENKETFVEKLDLEKLNLWEKIEIKINSDKILLDKFNVGIIPLDNINGNYLLVGGESCKKGECDDVYKISVVKKDNNEFIQIDFIDNLKLNVTASFIDKEFIKIKEGKFVQFEMKKNNLILFDEKKNKFKSKKF